VTLTHQLLAMAARSDVETGAAVPLAGRTRWTATLRVGVIEVAGSLDVVLEASATDADDSYETLAAFPQATADGTASLASFATAPAVADFTVQPWHRTLRARATAQTGDVTWEVEAAAPFVYVSVKTDPDAAMLSKELREFIDGLARLVNRAEEDVLSAILRAERGAYTSHPLSYSDNPWKPSIVEYLSLPEREALSDAIQAVALDIDLTIPGVGDAMRAAIVAQAEHLFRRHKLERSESATAAVTLRDFPLLSREALPKLRPYRPERASIWRGR
jgi:hypothetical protein